MNEIGCEKREAITTYSLTPPLRTHLKQNPLVEHTIFGSKKYFHSYLYLHIDSKKDLSMGHYFDDSLKTRYSGDLLYMMLT